MESTTKGSEGILPSIWLSHDAGIWRHVSELFDPKWFQLLQKGHGEGTIQTVEQWGEWLAESQNYGLNQGQNAGRVVFEKLISEGHGSKLPAGTLSTNGADQLVDYVAKTGEKIQLKHSIGNYVHQDIITGKYSPPNVDLVGVNSESYSNYLSRGFTETSPGSGIAIHNEHGTKLVDSGMKSEVSKNILDKAQDHARDNLKAFDLTEHLAINAMKAAGIAAALAFVIRGSVNLYQYNKGTIRGDDAVDNTVSCTLRAALTGGATTFVTGATMAAIGIPTAGFGLVVAIPIGVAAGITFGKVINSTFDAIYRDLMGGKYITMAREQNRVMDMMFGNLEQHFAIAEARQEVLDKKAAAIPEIPWEEMESALADAKDQIAETDSLLDER
jgi:hypothetical protein